MTTEAPTTETSSDEKDPAWYRKEIKRRDETIKELEAFKLATVFKEANVDTSKGLGKKLLELYDGPIEAANVVEFAKEFEYPLDVTPQEEQVSKVHKSVDSIEETIEQSQPIENLDQDQKIAEAEAAQDWVLASELKAQRFPHPG